MTLADFYVRVSYALRGTDEDSPTHGDDEAAYWLNLLNRKKDELFQDVSKTWRSTFKEAAPNEPGTVATTGTTTLTGTGTNFTDYRVGDKITVSGETVRTIATIPSATSLTVTVAFANTASAKTFTRAIIIGTAVQSYNLPRTFLFPSDKAYVTTTADNRVYFDIIQPQERSETVQQVFISDENPEALTFTADIESTDDIVGGTLTLPSYYLPADLSATTDVLPFPDPNWAVLSVASEIAFNDITYEDRSEGLNNKANALLRQMTSKNRRGTYNNPRTTPYNMYRIREPRREG